MMFRDRTEAGRLLGDALAFLKGRKDTIVLAIPRGGVPVGKEVASAIGAPLDIVITHKIGAPGNPELAVGAVTEAGDIIREEELVRLLGISESYLKREGGRQLGEIKERERKYRDARPFPDLKGKTVVIVDDGIATGSTIRAAVASVKMKGAAATIIAAPVAPPDAVSELSKLVDRVVCLDTPAYFDAIGQFYEDFEQVDDATVKRILADSGQSI